MEINKRQSGNLVELEVKGRLDGYWADHLASALDEEIREGSHHILLDLSQVAFLSSAGIGILVKFYKQLKDIRGSLSVSKWSEQVRKILEISGLRDVLLAGALPAAADFVGARGAVEAAPSVAQPGSQIEKPSAMFTVHTLAPNSRLKCRLLGDPDLLEKSQFVKESCRKMEFPDSSFAIGIGALGERFEECRGRFGEFIAAAGAVAYLPTDGTNVADYLVAAGASTPEVQICYGIACEGPKAQPFSHLIRFEAKKEAGSVTLAELAEVSTGIVASGRIGMLMVAEAAGLIGAALRRSPVEAGSDGRRFQFPGIRGWLSFTAERAYSKGVAIVAGIAVHGEAGPLAPRVRSLSRPNPNTVGPLSGHFHAAAFSYRPLQKGAIDLRATVKSLFEGQALQGVLHLLNDDRPIVGAGQSEFVRGACWIGPIREIVSEGDPL